MNGAMLETLRECLAVATTARAKAWEAESCAEVAVGHAQDAVKRAGEAAKLADQACAALERILKVAQLATDTRRWVIVKSSRAYRGGRGYAGPTCAKVAVTPGKVYTDRSEAHADASSLAAENPVGFEVVPYKEPEEGGPS